MRWSSIDPVVRAAAEQHLTDLQLRVLQDRVNGHSFRTIARATHRHEATVRGHYQAALDKLRKHRVTIDEEAA